MVVFRINRFKDSEKNDPAFRQRLIDCFANAMPLYDDRIAPTYNVKDGTDMSPVVVDAILALVELKTIFRPDVLYLSFVRLIPMPLIVIGLCRMLYVDQTATACGALLTGISVGSTSAILAKKYGADAGLASKCVFMSVVLSLLTIPLISLLARSCRKRHATPCSARRLSFHQNDRKVVDVRAGRACHDEPVTLL